MDHTFFPGSCCPLCAAEGVVIEKGREVIISARDLFPQIETVVQPFDEVWGGCILHNCGGNKMKFK